MLKVIKKATSAIAPMPRNTKVDGREADLSKDETARPRTELTKMAPIRNSHSALPLEIPRASMPFPVKPRLAPIRAMRTRTATVTRFEG